mmetsp:Transcript_44438/g.71175  ORF Transcript_44438/g.71175 Transcript_44438/m.71175 type:complete len:148 (-) Transcript_44438:163-606(-)|eukprot:CAMPEP_0197028866 /NCGR_PEP_ID=MMETSP1384-20130603/8450_1 /TAXON_ID=29189 /ORGANISM="Ammonia sp." /LENGTH=147 /DNA_ID=CAMNT_0042457933 /DNA_START=89 /DNA_END=532 /DNA_ORIENTATION=-
MAQLPDEEQTPNFSGTWELRTSEKLDEYLKDEGWGFVMRKAAAAVGATQIIVQDDKQIKITVKNKKGEYTYTAMLDGAECKYVDNDKDDVVSTTVLSDDKKSIVESMTKGKDAKKYKTYRYMEKGEMRLKIENASGKFCIRIFKKTA